MAIDLITLLLRLSHSKGLTEVPVSIDTTTFFRKVYYGSIKAVCVLNAPREKHEAFLQILAN